MFKKIAKKYCKDLGDVKGYIFLYVAILAVLQFVKLGFIPRNIAGSFYLQMAWTYETMRTLIWVIILILLYPLIKFAIDFVIFFYKDYKELKESTGEPVLAKKPNATRAVIFYNHNRVVNIAKATDLVFVVDGFHLTDKQLKQVNDKRIKEVVLVISKDDCNEENDFDLITNKNKKVFVYI